MPRGTLPLTPASSTDINGQDGTKQLAAIQMSFELPPPAMPGAAPTTMTGTFEAKPSPAPSDSSRSPLTPPKPSYPLQASETVKSRRRTASAAAQRDSFALPPPPTRSRRIIQMKPRGQEDTTGGSRTSTGGSGKGAAKLAAAPTPADASSAAPASGDSSASAAATATASAGSKKKQPSATSAAGRKIARKTAHSLIERRRRSKMNEEFATLKNMIPACTGEMHKLAILQASIEYVRYLEDCVAKLKAQRENQDPSTPTDLGPAPTMANYTDEFCPPPSSYHSPDADVEMTDSELPSPTFTASYPPPRSNQSSVSPALLAEDSRRRNNSYSSVSTTAACADQHHHSQQHGSGSNSRHYSFASSAASPAFGPQANYAGAGGLSHPGSTLTSPALAPQRDLDHEATAALLMLNSDRRGTMTGGVGAGQRGMSVRDLLST